MAENTITVVGNATREAEVRYSAASKAITTFGVALNERRKNDQGQWEDGEPTFLDVVMFGDEGENVAETIGRGDRVIVTGRIKVRDYEKNDGTKGRSVEIIADEVGVSLKWATATITKVRRDGGGNRDRDDRAVAGVRTSSGGGRQQQARPTPPVYDDQEPF